MSRKFGDGRPSKRRRLTPPDSDLDAISDESVGEDGSIESLRRTERSETENQDVDEDPSASREESQAEVEEETREDELPQELSEANFAAPEGAPKAPTGGQQSSRMRPERGGARLPRIIPKTENSIMAPATSTSVFKMQVEEMLRQARPDYEDNAHSTTEYLSILKSAIEMIPNRKPLPLQEAEKQLLKAHKIVIPFHHPRPSTDTKYKFAYSSPSRINVVGSYATQTTIKDDAGLMIDMVLHMPADLFEVKDYLNYRYFHKRAYYLASVAAGLKANSGIAATMQFGLLKDNPLHPVLQLLHRDDSSKSSITAADIKVQIMLAVSEGLFPIEKTLPDRNCVRITSHSAEDDIHKLQPTPFYNASVRADGSVNGYLKLLHSASARSDSFRDACILGRIWLRQRGFSSSTSEGGIGCFEWAVLMALLLESGGPKGRAILSHGYNSIQMFGATLHFLAHRDLVKNPLITDSSQLTTEDGGPMLLDSVRGMNPLFKMTASSYDRLRKEAQASNRLFGSGSPERFHSIFILRVAEPLLQYDLTFQISSSEMPDGPHLVSIVKLHEIMGRGLGDRASSIAISEAKTSSWPVNMSRPIQKSDITMGLVLDTASAARSVDRGPSAEDTAGTANFRSFWGEKAELRRFKDGEIRESLVWSTNDPIAVTKEIVSYLLERHLGSRVSQACRTVNTNLPIAYLSPETVYQGTYNTSIAAYRLLESAIRGLKGLPLSIRQIQPSGAKLRNTTIAPQPQSGPADVVVQFEASTRWPDDLKAIQMTKIAFLLKMQEDLLQVSNVGLARLGLENESSDIFNRSFLDVHILDHAFRIRIHHDRGQTLIQQRLSSKNLSPHEREITVLALAEHKRIFLRAPLLTGVLQRLATSYPAFPPSVRLVKCWFAAHLLGNHFREEAIELLTAKVFLHPDPWPVPSTALVGFLRTLSFLARWDWRRDPLVLDLSGGDAINARASDVAPIHTNFAAWRHIDPAMNRLALFIASTSDTDGNTWTEYAPSKVAAARMSNLAQAASRVIKTNGLQLELGSVFKPSLKDYDFVIRLRTRSASQNPSGPRSNQIFKNLQHHDTDDPALADFEPRALLLQDLERVYGDAAVFFANTGYWNVIAGLWSPSAARRKWKVSLGWSSMPVERDQINNEGNDTKGEVNVDVVANKASMLAEMARLGGDLVSTIEGNTSMAVG